MADDERAPDHDRAPEQDRTPDHDHDPRDQATAPGALPETQPDAATSTEGTDTGPAGDSGKGGGDHRTPSTATPKEGDRAASTGNPHAAG